MARRDRVDARADGAQPWQQGQGPETGQRIATLEVSQVLEGGGHAARLVRVVARPERARGRAVGQGGIQTAAAAGD